MTEIMIVRINPQLEKKMIMATVESIAFDNNGILFGGAVRDEIISQHYTREYHGYAMAIDEALPHIKPLSHSIRSEEFWDITVHPESAARTLVPEDLDIYFKNLMDAEKFFSSVRERYGSKFIVPENSCTDTELFYSGSFAPSMIQVKKCVLQMKLGEMASFTGYNLDIRIDVVFPKNTSELYMEPPFGCVDLLCNAFIKERNNSPRISKDAGEWYKSLSVFKKAIVTAKIIKNMLEFKTDIVKNRSYSNEPLNDICRYIKMMSKPRFPWTINNLPYDVVDSSSLTTEDTILCCICQCNLVEENISSKIAKIRAKNSEGQNIPGAKMHNECFLKFLTHQMGGLDRATRRNNLRNYTSDDVRCPFKSHVNFDNCDRIINWDNYLTL